MQIDKLVTHLPISVYQELGNLVFNSIEELSNFLGQCDHESENWSKTVENLNYSEQALKSLFGNHFPNSDEANYARNPEKIANRIYANRMGNSNEESGDGWKYRGRGYIQITGKENQTSFLDSVSESENEVISDKYPLTSAYWFWKKCGAKELANKGIDVATITIVTRHINGGNVGLENRINRTNFYYGLLIS